jgi:hypothetical protein
MIHRRAAVPASIKEKRMDAMNTSARERAIAEIREQVRVIWCAARCAPVGGDVRRNLFLGAARLEGLASEIESPVAPAWLLDMIYAGTSALHAGV